MADVVELKKVINVDAAVADFRNDEPTKQSLGRLLHPYKGQNTLKEIFPLPHAGESNAKFTGYVAVVSPAASAQPLVSSDVGTGVSWVKVERSDGQPITDKNTRNNPLDSVDLSEAGEGAHVGLMRVPVDFGSDFYVVARANHRPTAAKFIDSLPSDATIGSLVAGPHTDAYRNVIDESRKQQQTLMDQFMADHGLRVVSNASPERLLTHYICDAPGYTTPTAKAYAVYNEAFDPSEAKNGLVVFRGPIAGYSFLENEEIQSKMGKPSKGWSNQTAHRAVNVFPTHTGKFMGSPGRKADRHTAQSATMLENTAARIVWNGPVQSFNPTAYQAYHSMRDRQFTQACISLGLSDTSTIAASHGDTYSLATQGLDTVDMSASQLSQLFDRCKEPELPLRANNALFVDTLRHWDAVREPAGFQKRGDIFTTENNDIIHVTKAHVQAVARVTNAQA